MSEKTEQVARALYENIALMHAPVGLPVPILSWNSLTEIQRRNWEPVARAAIKAMEFATLPMIVAAGSLPEDAANHDIWKAMIKAAVE